MGAGGGSGNGRKWAGTRLALPDAEMNAAAVDMLLSMCKPAGDRRRHAACRPILVLRGSVGPGPDHANGRPGKLEAPTLAHD